MKKKSLILIILLASILILPSVITAAQEGGGGFSIDTIKDSALKIGLGIVIIGWVIAGILYLTSAGSPEKVSTAKKALIAAVVGTALIVLAETAYELVEYYVKP